MADATQATHALDHAYSAYRAGRLEEAEQLCQNMLSTEPRGFEALFLLGLIQSGLGKNEQALATYDQAIAVRPWGGRAHFRRGHILIALRRHSEAVASFDRAIQLEPGFAAALSDRGAALYALNRHSEALASYERAVELRPDFAIAHFNRGNVVRDLGRFEEALASYNRAVQLRPDLAEAHCNRGNVLKHLKRYNDALANYDRAISVRPNFAHAYSNRGAVLHALNRNDEALASYDRALELRPDYVDALCNRGLTLEALNRHDEALATYQRALDLQPDHAETRYAQALCRLRLGDFERGWQGQEWRWRAKELYDRVRKFSQPVWLGDQDIAGKTILVHAEQGFGDVIQFCRYIPLLVQRGARVIFDVPKNLAGLMTSLDGAPEVTVTGSALPQFDTQVPLLSLPLAFGTRLNTIPSSTPYIKPSPEAQNKWKARLASRRRPWIGLAWSGRPTHQNDHNRSTSLQPLLPLLDFNATFVSVQKDLRPEDKQAIGATEILWFGNDLTDFSETAALISNLDLLISVDTSVAHLAGAMAKAVWILLPFVADWRWLMEREDSPWYPTARLFRQDETRSWDGLVARIRTDLKRTLKGTT